MNKSPCKVCSHVSFCTSLKKLPHYHDFKVLKKIMRNLPKCFEETPLGEPKGEIRQYRGPYGSHVHEYKEAWVIHRDKVDPRFDPVGHLVNDAPHILVLGALLSLVFLGLAFVIGDENR